MLKAKTRPTKQPLFYHLAYQRISQAFLFILFTHFSASSQPDPIKKLEQQFAEHNRQMPQEKIFVHADKNTYLTGETIWFKLYVVDGGTHKSTGISKVAYVEIIDLENKPVLQAKIEISEGNGNGSFVLPAYLNSGNYIVRAYTNWMKNFDEDFFFHQSIRIINTSKKPDWQSLEKKEAYAIQFFPEGGNMVYD